MESAEGIHGLQRDRYLWEQRIHVSIQVSQEVDTWVIIGD